jgi:hypothetical protein
MQRRLLPLSAGWLLVPALALARPSDPDPALDFTPAESYATDVPPLEALLGHAVGERFVDHATVGRVLDAIDGASERVIVREYGQSHLGRPLWLALVSSPENLARLPAIERDLAQLADPRKRDEAARAAAIDSLPVVVWLSFSVHGNEASGTEAALPLLYHLAAAQGAAVEELLARCLVIVDPCLNPDGRERYVSWFRAASGVTPDPDPQAEEHREPWPGGRVNHYYFDLNRDWAFVTQRETQARHRQYRRFRPQVHADLHEMFHDSSYFFFPAAAPIHDVFPRSTLRFAEVFGRGNAAAFDARGWVYYTGEIFDLFYPGYGDSWPSLNGAIGMTYEQAGHSTSGLAVERDDGSVLTLRRRAGQHFVAALTTIETAAARRAELLQHFASFFEEAMWAGANGPAKEILLVPGADSARLADLVAVLLAQGIEVGRATQGFEARRARSFDGGKAAPKRLPAGTLVVSLAQPAMHLARALLEPSAGAREAEFYDLSAWSLPLAFGVEAYVAETRSEDAVVEPLLAPPAPAVLADDAPLPRVGYLARYDSFGAPRLLAHILGGPASRDTIDGVRQAGEPFEVAGITYPRGTLFVPAARLDADAHARLRTAAREAGVLLVPVDDGLTERGPDLGAESFRPLAPPRIAIVTGEGTDPNAAGALRWLLEQRFGFGFTVLRASDLRGADLRRYSVIALPDGFGYARVAGEAAIANLRRFAEQGGVVVGLAGAAFWLAAGEGRGLVTVDVHEPKDDGGAAKDPAAPRWRTLAERRIEELADALPGTLFRLALEPAHPLSYGYDGELAVLMDAPRAFALEGAGTRIGVFPQGARLAGHAPAAAEQGLAGSAYLADVPLGRGRVILFAGDPTFRGFVRGQVGLLVNALLLFNERAPIAVAPRAHGDRAPARN